MRQTLNRSRFGSFRSSQLAKNLGACGLILVVQQEGFWLVLNSRVIGALHVVTLSLAPGVWSQGTALPS